MSSTGHQKPAISGSFDHSSVKILPKKKDRNEARLTSDPAYFDKYAITSKTEADEKISKSRNNGQADMV